jgi:hypothetical protein
LIKLHDLSVDTSGLYFLSVDSLGPYVVDLGTPQHAQDAPVDLRAAMQAALDVIDAIRSDQRKLGAK